MYKYVLRQRTRNVKLSEQRQAHISQAAPAVWTSWVCVTSVHILADRWHGYHRNVQRMSQGSLYRYGTYTIPCPPLLEHEIFSTSHDTQIFIPHALCFPLFLPLLHLFCPCNFIFKFFFPFCLKLIPFYCYPFYVFLPNDISLHIQTLECPWTDCKSKARNLWRKVKRCQGANKGMVGTSRTWHRPLLQPGMD
jgi:hypothetical protein